MKIQTLATCSVATALDYLFDETGKQAKIKDMATLNRAVEIEHLHQENNNTILRVIDSLLCDVKAKKAYA